MHWFLWGISLLSLLPEPVQAGEPGPGRPSFEVRTVRDTYPNRINGKQC